jgi:hypothetical protein
MEAKQMVNNSTHHQQEGTQSGEKPAATRPPTLAELLGIWEAWSLRDLTERAVVKSEATGDARSTEFLQRELAETTETTALDALAANYELASLLTGWRWHAVRSARAAGATWQEIAAATNTTTEQARANYLDHIECSERYMPGADMRPFRAVLND